MPNLTAPPDCIGTWPLVAPCIVMLRFSLATSLVLRFCYLDPGAACGCRGLPSQRYHRLFLLFLITASMEKVGCLTF